MKPIVSIATLATTTLLCQTAAPEAHAKPAKAPAKLEGMEYLEARKVILGYGWIPVPGDCHGPDVDEKTCAKYPEVGNCTGVGIGFCEMTFVRRDRCLLLVAVGGAPQDYAGDTAIRDVTFSRGPCLKDPNN